MIITREGGVPMETFYRIVWLFFCYSFLGWLGETALAAVRQRRYVDRSLLFGPLCVAYGVAGPIPLRCSAAEAAAEGRPLTGETVETFARSALEDIRPRDSWRASKAFREHIAVELAKRALAESVKLAGGELA